MSSTDYVVGSIKWFNQTKGYGFIVVEDKDIFIHSKRLRESGILIPQDSSNTVLDPGTKLKFRIETGPKGAYAVEISKV